MKRAAVLGWARSRTVVIDYDLGVSAATTDVPLGFARLILHLGHLPLHVVKHSPSSHPLQAVDRTAARAVPARPVPAAQRQR